MQNLYHVVPLIWAQSKDGAIASDVLSLKNYKQADFFLMIGAVTKAAAVTVKKGVSLDKFYLSCNSNCFLSNQAWSLKELTAENSLFNKQQEAHANKCRNKLLPV